MLYEDPPPNGLTGPPKGLTIVPALSGVMVTPKVKCLSKPTKAKRNISSCASRCKVIKEVSVSTRRLIWSVHRLHIHWGKRPKPFSKSIKRSLLFFLSSSHSLWCVCVSGSNAKVSHHAREGVYKITRLDSL